MLDFLPLPEANVTTQHPSLTWDIFCQVIDNFGDVGVCWRTAAELVARGQQVRLWMDDASALQWMTPQPWPKGLSVHAWPALMVDIPAVRLMNETLADQVEVSQILAHRDSHAIPVVPGPPPPLPSDLA